MSMRITVNGLEQEIVYDHHALDDLIIPLLRQWIEATNDGRRHWAFLVAPPGAGKSVLAELIGSALAPDLQCLGLDGFHFPQAYLQHNTYRDAVGQETPLSTIKGAPETFDAERLAQYIEQSRHRDVAWPVYDRTLHDVVDGVERVTASHVLLEGNWLLLDDPRWNALRPLAERVIFIDAPEGVLRKRLVDRKVQGGLTQGEAEAFFERSDGPNVRRVLTQSNLANVDLLLAMQADGSLIESELS